MYDEAQHQREKKAAKEQAKLHLDDAHRQRLLAATLACAAEHGFHALTTDHVAAHADVSAGTLFRLFKTKTNLLRAAMSDAESVLCGRQHSILWGASFHDQLRCLWTRATDNALENPTAFHYWRLYRATPLDTAWGYPACTRRGPMRWVSVMLSEVRGRGHEHALEGHFAAAQWASAMEFVLAPDRFDAYAPEGIPRPCQVGVVNHAFEGFWNSLALDLDTPGVQVAFM